MAPSPGPPTMQRPPWSQTDAGRERRVGIELEFAGLDLEAAAAIVAALFGGAPHSEHAHRLSVATPELGAFTIELDSDYVHPSDTGSREDDLIEQVAEMARSVIGDVIENWMPREIVTPPIPLSRLPDLNRLCDALRQAGAVGTDARWHYAFSLQLNPEVPSRSCADVLAIFRAFLLMSDWLRDQAAQSMLRRALPFAQPFPRDYITATLAPDYRPDWSAFIDDYLVANPTRNRDLDLCPLMADIDANRVRRHLDDPRIKARPTFHYRLPDSHIEDPNWSVITEWNRWVLVERLAADPSALAERSAAYLAMVADGSVDQWGQDMEAWLRRRGDVPGSA